MQGLHKPGLWPITETTADMLLGRQCWLPALLSAWPGQGPKQAALLGTCNTVLSTGRSITMFTIQAARRGLLLVRVARGAQT